MTISMLRFMRRFLNRETAEGHAVRAVYMYSAMADLAVERDERWRRLASAFMKTS